MELIVPTVAYHVTAVFDVLVTVAVNCFVPEDVTVALLGLTVTVMDEEGCFDADAAVLTPAQDVSQRTETSRLKTAINLKVPARTCEFCVFRAGGRAADLIAHYLVNVAVTGSFENDPWR